MRAKDGIHTCMINNDFFISIAIPEPKTDNWMVYCTF